MKFFLGTICALCGFLLAQTPETPVLKSAEKKTTTPTKPPAGPPAKITSSELKEFEGLPEERRKLIEIALTTARDSEWLPYKFGGSEPSDGGFDCSGAMYYVLRKAGLKTAEKVVAKPTPALHNGAAAN